MFKSSLILIAFATIAAAIKLHDLVPGPGFSQLETDGAATISWDAEAGDPTFISLEIQNDVTLDSFEFARNIRVDSGSVTGILYEVPGGDAYYFQAVNAHNVLDVYATGEKFTVVGEVPPITYVLTSLA
ncbi:hypothetical protein NLJ89_g6570 [Agrocybe chaxingu]|uniref:Uncharacterized protein n=1 Tax=Agrocybe chaxingu TaxID=84603 RepID=A0A9W8MW97_9AGAR|nr:hypothetical protein NLJ89_g6570 [Agrocybe chaxingu]